MEAKNELTDKEQYAEVLKDLDFTTKDMDDISKVTHKKATDLTDKVTGIKDMVTEYQMNLEGKNYDSEDGAYVQTGI